MDSRPHALVSCRARCLNPLSRAGCPNSTLAWRWCVRQLARPSLWPVLTVASPTQAIARPLAPGWGDGPNTCPFCSDHESPPYENGTPWGYWIILKASETSGYKASRLTYADKEEEEVALDLDAVVEDEVDEEVESDADEEDEEDEVTDPAYDDDSAVEDEDPNDLVGSPVRKEFEEGVFSGMVESYNGHTRFYRVRYDDGDSEDLALAALHTILQYDGESDEE